MKGISKQMSRKVAPASFLFVFFVLIGGLPCLGVDKISSVTIDGQEIKEISRVSLRPDGRVMIIYGSSGGQYPAENVSKEFLSSWGITLDSVNVAKQEDFENAIRLGKIRVVDGVVYDLRQKHAAWTYFQNVKLVQRLPSGAALVDPNPDQLSIAAIHVLNLPDTVSDTDRFNMAAKQVGTYEYETQPSHKAKRLTISLRFPKELSRPPQKVIQTF